jgi:hypothetical protein
MRQTERVRHEGKAARAMLLLHAPQIHRQSVLARHFTGSREMVDALIPEAKTNGNQVRSRSELRGARSKAL